VHMNATPTQGEILHKQFRKKKEELKDTNKDSILATYGGEKHLQKVPKELLLGQTEDYVEYSQSGQILKGREGVKTKSKYHEDGKYLPACVFSIFSDTLFVSVYVNNHMAVWGSWYDTSNGEWGYACCHSTIHVSYCSGQAGIEAARASSAQHLLSKPTVVPESFAPATEPSQDAEERRTQAQQAYSKDRLGEGDLKLSEARLAAALREEKKRKTQGDEWDDRSGKRKKGQDAYDVTEEQLGAFPFLLVQSLACSTTFAEAYRMTRRRTDDPMANYVDTEA
jgi:pre-mRNA-processing factor SLU7